MIRNIFLAIIALVQLSCGGPDGGSSGSGGGSTKQRGKRVQIDYSYEKFAGEIIPADEPNSHSNFQEATERFMSAAIDPNSDLGSVVNNGKDIGIFFKGNVKHSTNGYDDKVTGGFVQLVVSDTLQSQKGGVFAPTFHPYNPFSPSYKPPTIIESPYVTLYPNGTCVSHFRAYFEDNLGDITLSGESFKNNNGNLWVKGKVYYENDECYCYNNTCNSYSCNSKGFNGFLGNFLIPYDKLFQGGCLLY